MIHLTRDELLAWRDAPSEANRARVIEHLASCDRCAGLYAEMIRTRPLDGDAGDARFAAGDFVMRGYAAAPLPAPRGRMFVFQRKLVIPLAAAAALVLFVWMPARRPAPPTPTDAVRGGTMQALSPSGEVRGRIEFRWTSAAAPDRFAVEVKDAAGQRVFYRETRDDRLSGDAALESLLRPGAAYTWTVAALDAAGETISRSTPVSFVRGGASR
jgi:hypothetical protein